MVFCNNTDILDLYLTLGHNPYFNRWFSAILEEIHESEWVTDGHNPYFNRWFSAIQRTVHTSC